MPSIRNLPNPGIEPVSSALAGGFFTAETPRAAFIPQAHGPKGERSPFTFLFLLDLVFSGVSTASARLAPLSADTVGLSAS